MKQRVAVQGALRVFIPFAARFDCKIMMLPPSECKVYTPPRLAGAASDDYWLDPCIGPGAFIAPLREKGVPRERIVSIDIDPVPGREDSAATTVRGSISFNGARQSDDRVAESTSRNVEPQFHRRLWHLEPSQRADGRRRTTATRTSQPIRAVPKIFQTVSEKSAEAAMRGKSVSFGSS